MKPEAKPKGQGFKDFPVDSAGSLTEVVLTRYFSGYCVAWLSEKRSQEDFVQVFSRHISAVPLPHPAEGPQIREERHDECVWLGAWIHVNSSSYLHIVIASSS